MIDDTANPGGEIVNAGGAKPAKRATKRRDVPPIDAAIGKVAAVAGEEIAAFAGQIEVAQGQWVDATAERILGGIADAPNQVVTAMVQRAAEYSGNAESFRDRGREFGEMLFGLGPTG
jgi:hypothetical protein